MPSREEERHMPRIPYPDLSSITDPEIIAALERAREFGTPRPESQAIRAHVPAVLKSFTQAWMDTFVNGVVEHELKELCRVYVTKTVQCGYCAAQRSVEAAVDEDKYDELLEYARSDRYTERERRRSPTRTPSPGMPTSPQTRSGRDSTATSLLRN
jgi:hypothetical protein